MAYVSGLLRHPVEIKATDHLQMQVITVLSQGDSARTGGGASDFGNPTIAQIRSKTSLRRVPPNKGASPARKNDMLDRRIDMTQTLEKGAARTITFFKALPPADLDRPVYVDDVHWTVRQVLAHFITIEKSMQWLFRNMLTGGPGSPQDFDLERFNRTQPAKLDGLSLDELIERFGAVRRETIAIVADMADSDFDRIGRHPFHGIDRLERFILWADEHARLHELDIRRVLKAARES
jgi:hypothetical protein